jgi:hypothetical protein
MPQGRPKNGEKRKSALARSRTAGEGSSSIAGWAHDLTAPAKLLRQPLPMSLSRWRTGVWLAPWDADGAVVPYLSTATDFVLVTNAQHDRDRGLHFDLGGCGTFGVDYGLGGATTAGSRALRR